MGQRHQIFIKIANPVFNENVRVFDKEEMKRMRKLFGRKKTTVIPLHHQWMFGRSAVSMLWNILNVTDPKTMGSENPFSPITYMNEGLDRWIEKLMAMVQVNTCPLSPRGVSYERMHFLLKDDDTIMREYFTMGDNNDGILIIDAIERKYCFMNIYEQTTDFSERNSVSLAPSMTPISALEYMRCYYAEKIERLQDYYKVDRNSLEIVNLLKDNILANGKLDILLGDVELLSLKEVKKIFPKVFKKVLA